MKNFSISNFAFNKKPIQDYLQILGTNQIKGLEIAPTMLWDNPQKISRAKIKEFKNIIYGKGFSIIALQSLLYGKSELQLFGCSKVQQNLLDYLKKMVDLCFDLGGKSLSFGSPKNRNKGKLKFEEAISRASIFFYQLTEYAESANISICIEPIPDIFDCDFITNSKEAIQLIKTIDLPNVKLLLDTGTLIFNREDLEKVIKDNIRFLGHVHINDPHLFPPSRKNPEHFLIAKTLKSVGYSDWLSFEFLKYYESLEQDILFGIECYG
jgi:sugar phosphate isomerase/epimerase